MKNSKEELSDKNATAMSRIMGRNANDMLWPNFIRAIHPIDVDEWKDAGWFGKVICAAKVLKHTNRIYLFYTEEFCYLTGSNQFIAHSNHTLCRLYTRRARLE